MKRCGSVWSAPSWNFPMNCRRRFRKSCPPRASHNCQDATTQPPRPHPNRLRRPPLGGQCRADPAGHPRPASRPARTRSATPRPGQCAGPGQHRRQDYDTGRFRAGGRRLHRRRQCVARWRGGLRSRQRNQGTLHPPPSRGQALGTFLRSFRWGHVVNWTG